ncbi:MAG: serine/threonine-protein phosphatase [Burkholderiaceae bacterium]|jgi:serine/threonine protein phosphatase PrpC|nr:serine/threonine-protein phosphatase [Betaproteobacteria bacterium]MBP6644251.1 serine/threonine-protein phosphatase [Burkholderiaceae bacterium]
MVKGYRLSAATGIHKGDREYQQDQVAFLTHSRVPGCVLGIVADGMGGRSGGRKASDQVMLTARQIFERYAPEHDDAEETLKQIAMDAHLVIKLTAISAEQEPHSTLAAFLLLPSSACLWITAGDSRVYHFHRDKLVSRTRDHSHVQALVDKGELKEKEADAHPMSNILTSCLGVEADPVLTFHRIPELQPDDIVLACSDGLWHYFSTAELGMVLWSLPPREAAEFLVNKARERARGGGDNLSLVLIKLEPLS